MNTTTNTKPRRSTCLAAAALAASAVLTTATTGAPGTPATDAHHPGSQAPAGSMYESRNYP